MGRPRTLRGRVATWAFVSTALTLVVFSIAAYYAFLYEETNDHPSMDGVYEDARAEGREHILIALAIAAPIGLALSTLGALWISRRSLSPLRRVIETAGQIDIDSLKRRIDVPGGDDELRGLVLSLNELLERLQRGHEALALFAAGASHEIRTPMAAVCNELEIALRRPRTTDEWSRSAETSLGELRRLARVVDALLLYARADLEAPERTREVDLAEIVDEVVDIHRSTATAERVGLVVAGPAGPSPIRGHRDLVTTAIANLITNAIRFTPAGGSVSIAIVSTSEAVTLRVDDTGPGVPLDERTAIFEPFVRGALGRRVAPAGLGLGLAMARRIMDRHGGALEVSASEANGARFSLRFPHLSHGVAPEHLERRPHA